MVAAADVADGGPVIDPDDPIFLPPGDMPTRLTQACRRSGQTEPEDRPSLVRCILDSLASAYARTVADMPAACRVETVDVLHIVGGGANNALALPPAARATGLPVVAGPVEATALGNILVQARAVGRSMGDLSQLRALVRGTQVLTTYPV